LIKKLIDWVLLKIEGVTLLTNQRCAECVCDLTLYNNMGDVYRNRRFVELTEGKRGQILDNAESENT